MPLSSKMRSLGRDGIHLGYALFCPGCEQVHVVYTANHNLIWTFNGNMESPTFNPSLLVWNNDIRCHSFIRNGRWEFCGDCSHDLAGKTVDIPDWPFADWDDE